MGIRKLLRSVAQGSHIQRANVRVDTHSTESEGRIHVRSKKGPTNFNRRQGKHQDNRQLRHLNRGREALPTSQHPEFKVAVSLMFLAIKRGATLRIKRKRQPHRMKNDRARTEGNTHTPAEQASPWSSSASSSQTWQRSNWDWSASW